MKRISSWFRSSKSSSDRREPVSEELLADLEAKAKAAGSGFRWVPLNRAGDLCDRAGDRSRALHYYGRAIDVMLEDGQPEPARGLATKIVRIHPTAVRTLCTLTWLDLASHHMASVVVHLTEYVKSAQGSGVQDLAGEQIYLMAQVAADQDFRCATVEALDALGHKDEAAEVRGWVAGRGCASRWGVSRGLDRPMFEPCPGVECSTGHRSSEWGGGQRGESGTGGRGSGEGGSHG